MQNALAWKTIGCAAELARPWRIKSGRTVVHWGRKGFWWKSRKSTQGPALGVQRRGLHLPVQRVWVQSLDRELTSHRLQGAVKSFVFKTSTWDFLSLRSYSLCHTISLYCYYFAIIPVSLHLSPLFWSMWKPFTLVGSVHSRPCAKYIVFKSLYYMIFSPIVCYSPTLEVKQLHHPPKLLNFEAESIIDGDWLWDFAGFSDTQVGLKGKAVSMWRVHFTFGNIWPQMK